MKRQSAQLRLLTGTLIALTGPLSANTIAFWDFEDGTDGISFTPLGEANGSGGSLDTVSSTLMRGWSSVAGPSFIAFTPPNGGNLAMRNADNTQDGYVTEGPLHGWSPSVWTIETHVYLEEIVGWETLIGRDGTSVGEPESDFYLANNGIDDQFRINIMTVGGQRWILDGNVIPMLHTWYGLAARSDGSTLSLWLDDGSGYSQIGELDISAQSVADNALPGSSFTWTFGRGWYNGNLVDRIDGKMDNIRFSDVALSPDQFIPVSLSDNAIAQWRLSYFGTTANTGDSADSADPDYDNATNFDEFMAGTDPTNGTSTFEVITSQGTPGTTLSFPSIPGRNYRIESSSDLTSENWTPVQTLAGTGEELQATDARGGAVIKFYRIVIFDPS